MGRKVQADHAGAPLHGRVSTSRSSREERREVADRAELKTGGRNNHGHVTSRCIGGGHKRRYRIIDFRRDKRTCRRKVASIEYDPNRTARIALLHYADGEKRYILAPNGLKVGDTVVSGPGADIQPGNCAAARTSRSARRCTTSS